MFFSFFNKKYNMYRNYNKYLLGTAFENVVWLQKTSTGMQVLVLFVFNFLCKIEDLLKQEAIVITRVSGIFYISCQGG